MFDTQNYLKRISTSNDVKTIESIVDEAYKDSELKSFEILYNEFCNVAENANLRMYELLLNKIGFVRLLTLPEFDKQRLKDAMSLEEKVNVLKYIDKNIELGVYKNVHYSGK